MDHKEQLLREKVAIVTGAGRGIGKAIALVYAKAGASVCCAARTLSQIEEAVNEIEQSGGRGLAVQTDVTRLKAVENMVKITIDTFGGLDILVINAGGSFDHSFVEKIPSDDWQKTIDLNLTSAYYCAKAAIPYFRIRGGGKIITIGSGLGHRGIPGTAAYACAKAGLWMLTRVLAQELWQENISVNELIPGPVDTNPSVRQSGVLKNESEWLKTPEDVTPLALFLATQPTTGPTAQSFSLMRRDN